MLRTRLKVADYAAALDPVNRIAKAADEADHHPDIDLRYNWVGLRLVSHDVGGISPRDPELAGQISRIAADPGAEPVPEVVTSMTVGIDTADADAIRPFWMALTGHGEAKGDASSLPSPDGQLPQIWFRESEAREGRGRVHLDVYVPHDRALARVEAVVAAGGRLVTDEFAPSLVGPRRRRRQRGLRVHSAAARPERAPDGVRACGRPAPLPKVTTPP
uniref:4a-hydroxytetrahydrobiopterin dehydratase n=1 Tax=Janibacter limosus TaxID=53458 RepID=A0AC61U4U8_9MICO|nr:4a-hydroxytetrahydrobiopterin dehydratase [Janibacter limosus]